MSFHRPMGDYKTYGYAGDPSWATALWAGIKPVLAGLLGGYLGGMGPPVPSATPPIRRAPPVMVPPSLPPTAGPWGGLSFPGGTSIVGGLGPMVPGQGRLPPFTATGAGVLPAGGRAGAGVPSGYHFAKDGSGRLVRNRRMNIANPRALRRAMRRVQGFEKLARRTITFTRRVKMKRRKS